MLNKLLICCLIVSTLMFSGCLIKGRVVDENGVGVAGVTINLSGGASMTTTTGSNGDYQFGAVSNMLSAGSYTVTPSGNFLPTSRNVTITTLTLEGLGDIPGAVGGVDFYPHKIVNSLGMEFVAIEPGTFTMGSPSDELGRDEDELQHQVTLTKSFYMQTTEVTQGQWKAVMGRNPSSFSNCGDDCPVETVSWNDVQDFISALNALGEGTYRLPTEAEWEYACRAGSPTAFSNGGITEAECGNDSNLDKMGWYCGNAVDTTHSVAQKQPNAWGLYDIHGNLWEWCQDWYGGEYSSGLLTDPTGPSLGSSRLIRSGSWADYAKGCRSANRNTRYPDVRASFLGFRLARTP